MEFLPFLSPRHILISHYCTLITDLTASPNLSTFLKKVLSTKQFLRMTSQYFHSWCAKRLCLGTAASSGDTAYPRGDNVNEHGAFVQRWLTGRTDYLKKTSRSEIKRSTAIYLPPVLNNLPFSFTLTIYGGMPTTRTDSSLLLLSILWYETKKKSTRNHSKFHTRPTGKPQLVQHTSHVHVSLQLNPLLSFHCAPPFVVGLS
jgi:hypothetical protein